jgi:uncharacterized protein YdeI (BOF family)
MKKLFSILILACALFAQGYSQEAATQDYSMGYNETWFEFTSTSNATTATDSLWYYTVKKEAMRPLKYDMYIHLDSVGGTNKRTVVTIEAKNHLDQASWTSIATKAWTTGKDTAINLTESSTAKQYRYWRFRVKSDNKGFIFKIDKLFCKYWE